MAETNEPEEPTLPLKRKPELSCEGNENPANKTQKLQALNNNSEITDGKTVKSDKEPVDSEAQEDNDEEEEEEDDDEYEDEDEEEEEEDVDGNGEAKVDRKGKGILIEEERNESDDEDDDDDSSDGGSQSDGDSDLSDDPLAEVDLDNILPSRTRRKVIQPGEFIANDLANDEDSGSDDEDA